MERAVRAETPDRVIHLGDVVRDAGRLAEIFPDLEIQQVRGNCDGAGYYVKMGLGMLVEEARVRGVDSVFFGHTHQPVCYLDGRLWVLNPGAIGGAARSVTYGVMEIRDREMSCRTAVLF